MTSNKDVHATGVAHDGTDLRRRNVLGGQNGALAASKEEVDEKKSQKVPSISGFRLEWTG